MDALEQEMLSERRPRTLTVLAVLMAVALVFSWLFAYAFADALVSAELLKPWSKHSDPRPRWLLGCFTGLMVVFGSAPAMAARMLHRLDGCLRQHRACRPSAQPPAASPHRRHGRRRRRHPRAGPLIYPHPPRLTRANPPTARADRLPPSGGRCHAGTARQTGTQTASAPSRHPCAAA